MWISSWRSMRSLLPAFTVPMVVAYLGDTPLFSQIDPLPRDLVSSWVFPVARWMA